jgi:putative DNA primase/helicase
MSENNRTFECAQYYISREWYVIPLVTIIDGKCSCGKAKCTSPGKHPHAKLAPKGAKNATIDSEKVQKWFGGARPLNIGICAGEKSRLVLLDVDPGHGGDESLKKYKVPRTLKVITGSGGSHYYFKHPGGDIRNSAGKLGPGLDVRGYHGYVVAPPSNHISGEEYRWAIDPKAIELADCPDWIINQGKVASKKQSKAPGRSTGATIVEGERESTLISIAGAMRRQGTTEKEIYNALVSVNGERCSPALPDADIQRLTKSVCKYDSAQKQNHLTDLGNAERFIRQHKDKLKFCYEMGKWLFWDGKRWNRLMGNVKANQLAIKTAKSIFVEAKNMPETTDKQKKKRKEMYTWAFKSEAAARLQAMLTIAKNLPPIVSYEREYDAHLFLLNCVNGTIDCLTGKLHKHKQTDMITKLAPVKYDPNVMFKPWDKFLTDSTNNNESLANFLQTAVGYSSTGDISEEKLFLIHGGTNTGKSTFLEAIKATLGEYALTCDFDIFIQNNNPSGGCKSDIARLAGARFVISVEVEEGKKMAEGIVKKMTGSDTINARFLYQEYFEFLPQFALWLAANDAPRVRDSDAAIWRRILRIPFDQEVPKEKRNPKLKQALRDPKKAGPAILAWIIKGCQRWHKEGLVVPSVIEEATAEYRSSQDPLKDFFEDKCVFFSNASVPVKKMRTIYEEWAREIGIKYPLGPREFNKRMETKGCKRRAMRYYNEAGTEMNGKCWTGVTLQQKPESFDELDDECEDQQEIPGDQELPF